jgi:hypothetical protein
MPGSSTLDQEPEDISSRDSPLSSWLPGLGRQRYNVDPREREWRHGIAGGDQPFDQLLAGMRGGAVFDVRGLAGWLETRLGRNIEASADLAYSTS